MSVKGELLNCSCIYLILNKINLHIYIGSAVKFRKRKAIHLHALRKGTHHSYYLQRSWNNYGESNFEFIILEPCNPENILSREQHYIDALNPEYNICRVAGNSLGLKRTDEQRRNISLAHIGQIAWNKGIPRTKEQNEYHSKIMKGRVSGAKGLKWSEESKKKMSEYRKDKKLSQQTKDRLSKPVRRINPQTKEEKDYTSIKLAAEENGIHKSNISYVCNGKGKKSGGYEWKFIKN